MSFRDDLYDIKVWLSEADLDRLERLEKRYGCSRSAVGPGGWTAAER